MDEQEEHARIESFRYFTLNPNHRQNIVNSVITASTCLPAALVIFVMMGAVYLPFLDDVDKKRILEFLASCLKMKRQSPFFTFRTLQPILRFATQCIECYNDERDAPPDALLPQDLDVIPKINGVRNPTAGELEEFASDVYRISRPKRQQRQWLEMRERVVHFLLITNPRLSSNSWSEINSDVSKVIMDQLWDNLGN
jgi:hypothetical protein